MGRCNSKVQDDSKQKRALNIAEAALYACVSRGTLNNWLVSGILPFEELPGRGDGSHRFRLIRKADLDAFLECCYHTHKKNQNTADFHGECFLLPKVS